MIYFIHGLSRFAPVVNDFDGVPPFLVGLNEKGWDIIGAKYPHRPASSVPKGDKTPPFAPFVAARANALRQQGYHRVIVGGQSWGGWLSLVAARRYELKADALILLAPANYGGRRNPTNGHINPKFGQNRSAFFPLINGLSTPSIAVFFANDEYDPGGRGVMAEATFEKRGLPHLVINEPAGFKGHGSGWFPFFDYAYGDCIAAFLTTLQTATCSLPPLNDADFRAVLLKPRIIDGDSYPPASPSNLAGRQFVAYTDDGNGALYRFASERIVQMLLPTGGERRAVTSRGDSLCFNDRCLIVLKWDAHRLIAFDPKTGAARSWWVEMEENLK